jgi:4-amino-4-deoxy-L-arabinose transferase-like glycosyltransferase
MDDLKEKRLGWILVGLLTASGLALRLGYLLRVPPFLDEYSSILTGMSILHSGGIPLLPSGVLYPSGSLFSYLESVFLGLLGFSDAVVRLPSLLIGGATLIALYLVAQRHLNRRAALLSVALLAFTPEAIVWGGRARMYALLQLLTLLTVYAFYTAVLERQPDRTAKSGIGSWVWVVCFLAAIFCQDEAILLLPLLWLAARVVRGIRWFLQPRVLLGQVLVPVAGVGARYWLNEIRVPGDVYVGMKASFFRFPPALAHGLRAIAPFFAAPSVWFLSVFFVAGVALMIWQRIVAQPESPHLKLSWRTVAPQEFLAYLTLALAAMIVLVVNTPWQDDRYLFLVLPLLLMVAAWAIDWGIAYLAGRWPALRSNWATVGLVALAAGVSLPGGLAALHRFEPDYSAAYRWLAPQLAADDLVTTVKPAAAYVYLGRCDFLVAERQQEEFIMRLNGVWVDRWAGAPVLDSVEAFRDRALRTGRRTWFVIDEDRLESSAYSPEFVAFIARQMDLVWHNGGVLVFQGQGYRPDAEMTVTHDLDVSFGDQVLLRGYALSTDRPEPGQELTLQLFWQAIRPERNYSVFVHLIGADGQGLAGVDGEPLLGLYGMSTHWPRDRAVTDERVLLVPADAQPGYVHLVVGLYDADDPESTPLPIAGSGASSVTLDYVKVDVPPAPAPRLRVDDGNLANLARLEGYDLPEPATVKAGATLPVTLTWECLGPFEDDFTVFVHLVGPDGVPLAQADSQPLGGRYPTSYWDAGERLADPYHIEIPFDLPPGEYELRTGMYLLATGERLPVVGDGDTIFLTRVEVESP